MKTNKEILRESFMRMRTGKWFWRMAIVMTLLGYVNSAANSLVDRFYLSHEIMTWFRYLEVKVASLVSGVECAVPSRAIALQMNQATAFAVFIAAIFGGIMLFGVSSVMLKAAKEEDSGWFSRSFAGFARPLGLAWLGFVLWVRVAAWTILLVVPGVVAGYRYSQCWNVKVENPDWGAGKCIAESSRMMQGHKMQRFLLDLFFVALAAVIGVFVLFVVNMGEGSGEAEVSIMFGLLMLVLGAFSMLLGMWMSVARAIFYTSLCELSHEKQHEENDGSGAVDSVKADLV
jgi:hypothetical protein